jgi:SpoVK/Ycf46/Vps4 family AAA+-type ATPase
MNVEYNINMNSIRKIKPYLEQLDNLIGMKTLKENLVDQILYYVQDFHKMLGPDSVQNDYMHTVIYGPPGTGKTEVAKIMGQIFSNLGVLKNNVFKKVTREDLVAGYLGQTATKTKEVLQSCKGGVLFIDEAYALGNAEKKDSFSKESIDTICEALSDMRGEFMCIIAGYEKELKDCFFSYNEGLESRFTWRFKIDEYNSKEMNQIFAKKVKDLGWKLDDIELDSWFEKEMSNFRYFGRDMETLLSKSKIAHSRRVFCLEPEKKGLLIMEDLEKGMSMFMNNDLQKDKEDKRFQEYLQNTLYL